MSAVLAALTPTQLLVEAKRAVIQRLQVRQAAHPALANARIDYAYNPKLAEAEYVWGGAARYTLGMAGLAGPVDEQISLQLFCDVRAYAAELEDADVRGAELAAAVEHILLDDPRLGGAVPGLVYRSLTAGEVAYGYYDDDTAMSSLAVDVLLRAHLGSGR